MKRWLPLAQVALATILMASNLLRPYSQADPTWQKPDRQLCAALNAPAAVLAEYPVRLIDRWLGSYYPLSLAIEGAVYLSLIWAVWYVVCIEAGGKRGSVVTSRVRRRRWLDALLIVFGAVVGVCGTLASGSFHGNYARLIGAPYLIWALVIIGFYSRDLVISRHGFRRLTAE